jgi:hypothetical protein
VAAYGDSGEAETGDLCVLKEGGAVRDALLDVCVEISTADMDRYPLGETGQILLDKLRPAVDEAVAAVPGARLVLTRGVELHVGHGEHKLTGESMLLVSSRWPVLVPEGAGL